MATITIPKNHPNYHLQPDLKDHLENSAKPKNALAISKARSGDKQRPSARVPSKLVPAPAALPLMHKAQKLLKRASMSELGGRKQQLAAIMASYEAAQLLEAHDAAWEEFCEEAKERRPELAKKLRRKNVLKLAIFYAHDSAEHDLGRRVSLFVRAIKPFFDEKLTPSDVEQKIKFTEGGFKGLASAHTKTKRVLPPIPFAPTINVVIDARLSGRAAGLVNLPVGTVVTIRARIIDPTEGHLELDMIDAAVRSLG